MAEKIYTSQFARLLPNIFEQKQYFVNAFGGSLQVVDGISNSDTFLKLKVSDTDVVLQEYNTGENVAFGTGTESTNRFGPRKEVKSVDTDVSYDLPLAIHEGVDNFTVNDNADQVVEERAQLHAEAWDNRLATDLGKTLSANASELLTETEVAKAFAAARSKLVDAKINKNIVWRAYVTPEVYNLIVDHKLTTSAKRSSANIDEQEVFKFKGFVVEEVPSEYFQEGENVIFAVDNVGVVGMGIEIYRIFDAHDFYGVTIQGAAKAGKYIPDKNKVAIMKANINVADEAVEGA